MWNIVWCWRKQNTLYMDSWSIMVQCFLRPYASAVRWPKLMARRWLGCWSAGQHSGSQAGFGKKISQHLGLLWWHSIQVVNYLPANAGHTGEASLIPGSDDALEKKWQPTPVFLLGEFQGQGSLEGYSPWGLKELDTSEHTRIYTQINTHVKQHMCSSTWIRVPA